MVRVMKPVTPRLSGLTLKLTELVMRNTPLPRLLARRVIGRTLAAIDFTREGEPAPFYMPPSSGKTPQ